MILLAKRATSSNLSKYGSIAGAPAGAPTSAGAGYKFWSDIAHYHVDGDTEIGLCTVFERPGAAIDSMERHLRTPEILVPIDAPFALPVMTGGDAAAPEAFLVNPGEAIVINRGIWHGACIPVRKHQSSYFVIFRRGTPGEDVEKQNVAPFNVVTD